MATFFKTFFVSYTQADKGWAVWIAWQLEAMGHKCVIQAWDSLPGMNFVAWMDASLKQADHLVAVLSPDYLTSTPCKEEWTTALGGRLLNHTQRPLLPVRVREMRPDWQGLLAVQVQVDLVGRDEAQARQELQELLRGLAQERVKPTQKPTFPGEVVSPTSRPATPAPLFPGRMPEIFHLPQPPNPLFTGRQELLEMLHGQVRAGNMAALTQPRAVYGLGGVGKSLLALEFCYRHSAEFDLIWWLRAESETTLTQDLVALGKRLGVPDGPDPERARFTLALLGQTRGWLLVYDNAPDAETIFPSLPRGGRGAVIITSRDPNWRQVASASLEVEVLPRDQAADLLLQSAGRGEEERAEALKLADTLGGLPLALAQAGAYMADLKIGCAKYAEFYQNQRTKLFSRGKKPLNYPETVATTWEIAFQSLPEPARQLLNLLAFLDPDDVPLWIFTQGPEGWPTPEWDELPELLAATAQDELAWGETIGALRRHGLVTMDEAGLSLHRLVQAVTRDRLGAEDPAWATRAARLVRQVFRHDDNDLATWPRSAALLPHALAVAAHARAVAEAQEAVVELWGQAGGYLKLRARYREAEKLYRQALGLSESLHGPDHPDVALRANNLGSVLRAMGDLPGAKAHYERALGIGEASHGPDHPQVAIYANNLGSILQDLGELPGAKAHYERALRIDEAAYGPDHPKVAIRANNLGDVLHAMGDLPGAKAHYERALRIDEAIYGPDHPNVAVGSNNLGVVLKDLGDLAGAKAHYERALRIDEAIYGPDHPNVAVVSNNLGGVLRDMGDLPGAKAHYERALRIDEAAYGPDHPEVATDANNLGLLLAEMGEKEQGWELVRRALEIREKFLGPGHPNTQQARENLAILGG